MHPATTPEPVAPLPISKHRCAASLGGSMAVLIAGSSDADNPQVFILAPHLKHARAGIGTVYTLTEGEAAGLMSALYASLTPAGRYNAMDSLDEHLEALAKHTTNEQEQ